VFDKRRAKRGDDGQPVVTPDPGSFTTRLNEARFAQAVTAEGAAQPSRRAGVCPRSHGPSRQPGHWLAARTAPIVRALQSKPLGCYVRRGGGVPPPLGP
jgi:hypothetical protein